MEFKVKIEKVNERYLVSVNSSAKYECKSIAEILNNIAEYIGYELLDVCPACEHQKPNISTKIECGYCGFNLIDEFKFGLEGE